MPLDVPALLVCAHPYCHVQFAPSIHGGHAKRCCSQTCAARYAAMKYYRRSKGTPIGGRALRPCERCGVELVGKGRRSCHRHCCRAMPVPDTHPSRSTPVPPTHPCRRDNCVCCLRDFVSLAYVRASGHGGLQFVRRGYCSKACIWQMRGLITRAKKHGVAIETVAPGDIERRDRGLCGLCGERVDPFTADHMMLGCLDHVIPLAVGGTHERANLQLAHRRCNASKGSRVTPADVARRIELAALYGSTYTPAA